MRRINVLFITACIGFTLPVTACQGGRATEKNSGEAPCLPEFLLTATSDDGNLLLLGPGDMGGMFAPSVEHEVGADPVILVAFLPGGPKTWKIEFDSPQPFSAIKVFCQAGLNANQSFSYDLWRKTIEGSVTASCTKDGGQAYQSTEMGQPPFAFATCAYDGTVLSMASIPATPDTIEFANGTCFFEAIPFTTGKVCTE